MILLSYQSKTHLYPIESFDLNVGEIAMLCITPKDGVKMCERNPEMFSYIKSLPHWVDVNLVKMNSNEITIINDNMSYLSSFFSNKQNGNFQFTKKTILSGWDIRLINLFIMRKRGINFFELHTSGLSVNSILLMFRFMLKEMEETNYQISYLVIEPNFYQNKNNPIFIDNHNYMDVFNNLYSTSALCL